MFREEKSGNRDVQTQRALLWGYIDSTRFFNVAYSNQILISVYRHVDTTVNPILAVRYWRREHSPGNGNGLGTVCSPAAHSLQNTWSRFNVPLGPNLIHPWKPYEFRCNEMLSDTALLLSVLFVNCR